MKGPAQDPLPDEELLRLALEDPQGSSGREAAAELFGRYQRRVYLWCLRFVRRHEEALDLAQDVLLSAYRALGSFRGTARFSSWLFAVARNRCLSAMEPVSLLRDEGVDPERLPSGAQSPDGVFEGEEGERRILELIRRELDPLQQDAVWLRCFERLPVEEITRILGVTAPSGARGILQSARRRLRAALQRRRSEGSGSRR
jgi:RNA polymerase sigma-70 factor (ECF subfamily)